MEEINSHAHSYSILNLLKIDQYFLRENHKITKEYLILIANKNNVASGDLLFLLKNILKYLKIPKESCFFLWPNEQTNKAKSEKMNGALDALCEEIQEVFLKIGAEFIFNFGVDLDISFTLPVTMQTLDLSSVLLDPKLKRQVFEDVSRLLLSPTGA